MLPILAKALLLMLVVWQIAFTSPLKQKANSNPSGTFLKRLKRASLMDTLPSFDQIKNAFVEKHNSLRRSVSPSASDMRQVSWDDELEQLAKDNSAKCNFAHSKKLRTSKFKTVGENIHIGLISPTSIPDRVTQLWFDEVDYYTYNDRTCLDGKNCSHYLQVVWANTYKIGCGISTCRGLLERGAEGYITICHYGPNGLSRTIRNGVNTMDFPYQAGEACSACDQGSVCNNGLCNFNDKTKFPAAT